MSSPISDRALGNARGGAFRAGAAILVLLAGCGAGKDGAGGSGTRIACLLPGKSGYEEVCTIDRMVTPDGVVLTAREPDGGFRRFLIVKDGRGVIAADGAEPVAVKPVDEGGIDVTAGGTVFRLPARTVP